MVLLLTEKLPALREGIQRISDGQKITANEFMSLYTVVYNLSCQNDPHDYSKQLYEEYTAQLNTYAHDVVLRHLKQFEHDGETLLVEATQSFKKFDTFATWIQRIFGYLDRHFVETTRSPNLADVSKNIFETQIYAWAKAVIVEFVVHLATKEREGQQIPDRLIADALKYVGKDSAEALKSAAVSFYDTRSVTWIAQMPRLDYIAKVYQCLDFEKSRNPAIMEVVDQFLTKPHINNILEPVDELFQNMPGNAEHIHRLYYILARVNALAPLTERFHGIISKVVVSTSEEIMDFHDKCISDIVLYFSGDSEFHKQMRNVFNTICQGKAGDFATFCDTVLRKKQSMESFERILKLVAYVQDKDIFAELYRKKLARRLLFDKELDDDQERQALSLLKTQFGSQFVMNMEGMLNDIQMSREKSITMDKMHIHVLTTGHWPSYKQMDMCLPDEMQRMADRFQEEYEQDAKRRKLQWVHSLGSCIVTGKFKAKKIELLMSTVQAACVFGIDTGVLTVDELSEKLKLSVDELTRNLDSLTTGKYAILKKEDNAYAFNAEFTDASRRIRIPPPSMGAEEKKKLVEDVEKDRKYAVDATIVRIMKSKRTILYKDLITEVVNEVNKMFTPDIKLIKLRIEDLIQREYMERDRENQETFHYVA